MPGTTASTKRERVSFAKTQEILEMPNLIEIQQKSYEWFLDEGLREVFRDISPIQDFTGNLVLEFIDYTLGEPKYEVDECKERDANYAAPLRVKVRLINKETGEVKEQEVFMGDFPLMTEKGTFIINGAERVIVSQLVRSPGVYFGKTMDTSGKEIYSASIIPNRGAWLEFEFDLNNALYVRIDRTRKLPVTVILKAVALVIMCNLWRNSTITKQSRLHSNGTIRRPKEALIEIYKRLRPGELPMLIAPVRSLKPCFLTPKDMILLPWDVIKSIKNLI